MGHHGARSTTATAVAAKKRRDADPQDQVIRLAMIAMAIGMIVGALL